MRAINEQQNAVAIYARYSTDRQDACSIDDQVRRCRKYADDRGCAVAGVYEDAAQSGSNTDRDGLQRLLADAHGRTGAPFGAVLVDDLSRLSRNLGDTWRLVFENLASVNVTVISVGTGTASNSEGARLTMGVMALMNDNYIENVRRQTHRGLEGRALKGFCTGGRVFGYGTKPEPNPTDRERPRKVFVIKPGEAEIVLRIYRDYADGQSYKSIAAALNAEGIESPYSTTRWREKRRGWASGTIRALLLNERYVGRFHWNKRRFIGVRGKNRKAVARDPSELVSASLPELAIVPEELRARVQARLAKHAHARQRPAGSGRTTYLLTGILRCGQCGGSMSTVGSKTKAGVRYVHIGCSAHWAKGDAICGNKWTVGERKITKAVVGHLAGLFADARLACRFAARVCAHVRELQARGADGSTAALIDKQVAAQESRIRNLTNALAMAPASAAIVARLTEEEQKLATLRRQRATADRATIPNVTPDVSAIQGYLRDLFGTLEADPVRGRALLERHLGQVVMTPKTEGPEHLWEVSGAFDLSLSLSKYGCGGRI